MQSQSELFSCVYSNLTVKSCPLVTFINANSPQLMVYTWKRWVCPNSTTIFILGRTELKPVSLPFQFTDRLGCCSVGLPIPVINIQLYSSMATYEHRILLLTCTACTALILISSTAIISTTSPAIVLCCHVSCPSSPAQPDVHTQPRVLSSVAMTFALCGYLFIGIVAIY